MSANNMAFPADAGRAGGPSDLSRDASQPKALIPNAEELPMSIQQRLRDRICSSDSTDMLDFEAADYIDALLKLIREADAIVDDCCGCISHACDDDFLKRWNAEVTQ